MEVRAKQRGRDFWHGRSQRPSRARGSCRGWRSKLPFIRPERAMETWREHQKILRALARRASGAAQKAMHEHVRNAALRTAIAFVAPATS
ncbi:FCD domain-containing protein [Pseudomonas sp. AL03]|nr:FCD domain-containing protein [Pseudomonas sp. AL03]MDI3271842.1 FCD domain-containing protein [Pseudomonas sp. AL03]